jgi:hypothetical protein
VAQTLILDSEALNALANPGKRGALALRCRTVLQVAYEERALVRVPAAVLSEACRGTAADASIDHVLRARGIVVVPLTEAIARRAGALLKRAKLSSAQAVDAFVIATAETFAPAVVATGDAKDLMRLAAPVADVRLLEI